MAKAKPAKRKKPDPFNGAPLTPGNPGNSGGKKGRSGRPPGWLKQRMAEGREKAVERLVAGVEELDPDQCLKLVKEWTPPEEREREHPTLIVRFVRE